MGERSLTTRLLVAFFGALTVLSVIGFSLGWRSEVASEEGKGIDSVITYLLLTTGVLVVLGHAVLIRFVWRSTDPEGTIATGRPSRKAEWRWSVIPVLVMFLLSEVGVLVFGSPTWKALYIDRPKDPLVVEVVGKQFEWHIRYPGKDGAFGRHVPKYVNGADNPMGLDEDDDAAGDDVILRSKLYLELGRPVLIKLRTHDVIHSFFVPDFRVKQDIIPGFATSVHFTPTKAGEYELACAELCGMGHYQMGGIVRVLEPDAFAAWLAGQETFMGD